MLADAAHEAMSLTRLTDKEDVQTERLCAEVEAFEKRILMLFGAGQAVSLGFTQHVLETLKKRPVLIYCQGQPKMIGRRGGVDRNIVAACMKRMKCWVRLARDVLGSEFPNFNVFTAFSVFQLPKTGAVLDMEDQGLRDKLRRLAGFFRVRLETLKNEFADYFQLACVFRGRNGGSCRGALRAGFQAHPVHALRPVLAAWIGWSCSSSGVEQNFANLRSLLSAQCGGLSDGRVDDILLLSTSVCSSDELDQACSRAQDLWLQYFGQTRLVEDKVRVRRKSDKAQNVTSEAGWLRRRVAVVKAAAQRWLRGKRDAPARAQLLQDTEHAWDEGLQKESEHQQKKRFWRLVQADKTGLVLPADRGNNQVYLEKKRVVEKNLRASQRQNDREAKRRRSVLEAPVRPRFVTPRGPLHVDSSLTARMQHAVSAALPMIDVCRDRTEATHFVVPDVTAPSQRTEWACALLGGCISDAAWITSRGRSGFCLQYRAATTGNTRRQVWVSPAWCERHAGLFRILEAALQRQNSKWRLIEGNFLDVRSILQGPAPGRNSLRALVTPGDKQRHQILRESSQCLLLQEFLDQSKIIESTCMF